MNKIQRKYVKMCLKMRGVSFWGGAEGETQQF